jgi:type VI secretion system protein ImpJ
MSTDRKPVTLGVGKLRLQFGLAVDDLADKLKIPLARIIEVQPDRRIDAGHGLHGERLDVRAPCRPWTASFASWRGFCRTA